MKACDVLKDMEFTFSVEPGTVERLNAAMARLRDKFCKVKARRYLRKRKVGIRRVKR